MEIIMYQDLLLKDLVSTSTVVREYVCTKKHQEMEICFLETEIRFLVTPKQNFISETLRNRILFLRHSKTEFRFHLKRNSISGLHYSINPNIKGQSTGRQFFIPLYPLLGLSSLLCIILCPQAEWMVWLYPIPPSSHKQGPAFFAIFHRRMYNCISYPPPPLLCRRLHCRCHCCIYYHFASTAVTRPPIKCLLKMTTIAN